MRVSEEIKATGWIIGIWSVIAAAIWIVCPIAAQELSPYRDVVPVEGKKNRDKHHRHDEPVTPAPLVIPEPDPAFPDVEIERRPKRPDRVEPNAVTPAGPRTPIAPAAPVVIYRGGWSSWFSGVFMGLVIGIVGSWVASLINVGAWIRRLIGQ
jgi:hypothetical protein